MFRYFFLTTILILVTNIAYGISLNSISICTDKEFEEFACKYNYENNSLFDINETNKIFISTSVNNPFEENQILTISFTFYPDKENNNFEIENTIYEDNTLKPVPKKKREQKKLSNIFQIKLLIKNSPSFRTFASKTLDKYMHRGEWSIEIRGLNSQLLYSAKLQTR